MVSECGYVSGVVATAMDFREVDGWARHEDIVCYSIGSELKDE